MVEKAVKAVYAKIHERQVRGIMQKVVAACDAELLGRVFSNKDGTRLDLRKYRRFYEGRRVSGEELAFILSNATNVNLVGEKTIAAASKVLPLSPKDARRIGRVPHVQYYRI